MDVEDHLELERLESGVVLELVETLDGDLNLGTHTGYDPTRMP